MLIVVLIVISICILVLFIAVTMIMSRVRVMERILFGDANYDTMETSELSKKKRPY